MLIKSDSPLRRPPSLAGRERLFVDGLRYAIEMADYAHRRLLQDLLHLTVESRNQKSLDHEAVVAPRLDAWSYVDSIDRLRGLINKRGNLLKPFEPSINLWAERRRLER
jgi:hypothetical protein